MSASVSYQTWSEPSEVIAFSPLVPATVQYVLPVLGTQDTGGYQIAGLLTRALLAVPIGSDAVRLRFMGAGLGAVAVMLGVLIIRRLGSGWGPAMASGLALMFSATLWSRAVVVHPGALTAVLFLGTVLSLCWWVDTRRPGVLWLMAGLYALGVGSDLTLVALVPGLLVFLLSAVTLPRARLRVVALCLGATVVGVLHHEFALFETWQAAPFLQPESAGGSILSGTRPEAGVFGPLLAEAPVAQLGIAGRLLTAEFGLVGLGLLVGGVAKLVVDAPRTAMLFGVSTSGVLAWAVLAGSPSLRASLLVPALLMWLLVGVGVSWLMSMCATRSSRVLGVLVILVLPASTLFATFNSISLAERASGSQYFTHLFEALPENTAMVAESDRFDRALSYARQGRADGSMVRVAQHPAEIKRLDGLGYSVFAAERGRAWLELLGLGFVHVPLDPVPMTLSAYFKTIPRGSIVAAAGGPGFTQAIEPADTPTFSGIGGAATLFGGPPFYGIVGVRGTRRGVVEHVDADPIAVTLVAGDQVGEVPLRIPLTLQISSDQDGGRIAVNGQPVASTRTGLAIAVLSPDGRLLDTHAIEYAGSLRIPVHPGRPALARLYGWEPCRDVGSMRWVDVLETTAAGRVGGLFGRDLVPAELVIYWASNHPLTPQVEMLPNPRPADVELLSFRAVDPGAVESLRRVLETDRFPDPARLLEQAYVYRVHVRVGSAGQRLLTARVDGFPDRAFARLETPGNPAGSLGLCGGLTGAEPLLANGGASPSTSTSTASADVSLDAGYFFPYGWHNLERARSGDFRWTVATEAEVVVEIARTGQMRVQIEARPPAGAIALGPTLSLQVNDQQFAAYAMEPGNRVYSWLVPATVWKAGANRLRLGVSQLTSPAADGQSADTRLLGAAVRMIRLELLGLR